MSDVSENNTEEVPPRSGRSKALLLLAVGLVAVVLALTGWSAFWTEKLWYGSLGFTGVFSTLFWTRLLLFTVFGLAMGGFVGLNLLVAWRSRPVVAPTSVEPTSLERYREVIAPLARWVVLGIAAVVGIFAGVSGAGQWRRYLLWRNGPGFGEKDPYFGHDLGFYVFDLPWWQYVVDFATAMTVLGLVAAVVTHYLYGGIRLGPGEQRLTGAAVVQFSLLLGGFMAIKAVDYWLGRYDLLTDNRGLITGMTFALDKAVLPARTILAGIALICAGLFLMNLWRRTWLLPSVGLSLLVLSAVLLGMVWPAVVQKWQVEPSQADKEQPYLQRNIAATRKGFDIEKVAPDSYAGEQTLPSSDLARVRKETAGVRLVDPRVAGETFEQKQQIAGYFQVQQVLDVDRYEIDGQKRELVVAAREMNQAGIPEGSKNWANLHTVYTHGNGLIAAYANQKTKQGTAVQGDPAWAETGLPPRGALSEMGEGYDGRIYYGEGSPSYSVVGKASADDPDVELDMPRGAETPEGGANEAGGEVSTTYDGKGGVSIGSTWRRLLYAVRFSEPNLMLSDRVNENSKILYDRNPRQMVEKVAPWLTVDSDPFPTVVDGRITWVVDGYTTSADYPLSQRESMKDMTADSLEQGSRFDTLPTDDVNYLRNAVKATVDAYDGTVKLYAWDEDDPILKAWSSAFDNTVLPKSEIPAELTEHLRYPEDQFKAQRYQLARYHVTDADDFYKDNDRWTVPEDPNNKGKLAPPYRLAVGTPKSGGDPRYSLTSVYTPYNKQNLASFVSVNSDATSEDYGTFEVLRLNKSVVPGPNNVANEIQQNSAVSRQLVKYRSSKVTYGNLLTLPVADGLLYVQPIYTQRETGAGNSPALRYVAVMYGDKVGVGQTLEGAIANVLSEKAQPAPKGGGEEGSGSGSGSGGKPSDPGVKALLKQASDAFARADKALAEQKLDLYAREVEAARKLLDRALKQSEESGSEGGPGAGSGGGSGG